MQSSPRYCKNCGHRCHCYSPDCEECVNDVCTTCDCSRPNVRDIPDSFVGEN